MTKYSEIEAKRQRNIEDNRRFLAALKINDIRDQIKDIRADDDDDEAQRRTTAAIRSHQTICSLSRVEVRGDAVRRGSRRRKKIIDLENFGTDDERPKRRKKTDENRVPAVAKVKLELPEHMLTRYHSNGKRVPLHNHKATFADNDQE